MSLHTQNPEHRAFSGILKTSMTIGKCALVDVSATVDDGEIMALNVTFDGKDITDTISDETDARIEYHLAANWSKLTQQALREYAAEAA